LVKICFLLYIGVKKTEQAHHKTKHGTRRARRGFWLYTAEGLKHVNGSTRGAPRQFAIKGLLATRTIGKVQIENVEPNPVVSRNLPANG